MTTNFVLVDFENVQPRNMGLLKGEPFQTKVFLGASEGKIVVTGTKVAYALA
jgi:hypothetical protein